MVRPTALCVGAATLDVVVEVDRMPNEDGREVARESVTSFGGPAAVAALTLARLGVDVAFAGVVGTDTAGDAVVANLERNGVDISRVIRDGSFATATSAIIIETTSTGRRIITSKPPRPAPVHVSAGIGWVHVDHVGYQAAPNLAGARLSVDDGNPVPGLDLARVDLYAPTLSILQARLGPLEVQALLRAAQAAGAGSVVATDGANGCYVAHRERVTHVPAFRQPVRSTLGAGDVFHGALLAAAIRGLDPFEAARFAAATAALSCRSLDAVSGIPALDEVNALLAAATAASW
ncbi:PfkB family carbohydrate kinase [Micromonospora sp. NPDC005206]|uniref:carbohydrate kinase family protein n=1 Tax=Micromonospora sp. NPDC005206 TaxID=3157022 RepID=UPI0033A77125